MRWISLLSLDVERLKGFQLQGGFALLTPWWGLCPWTPALPPDLLYRQARAPRARHASVLHTLNLKIGTVVLLFQFIHISCLQVTSLLVDRIRTWAGKTHLISNQLNRVPKTSNLMIRSPCLALLQSYKRTFGRLPPTDCNGQVGIWRPILWTSK